MLTLRNPTPEDFDPPPAYTDGDPAFSSDPMDNPHLYSYSMDTSKNADAKRSHLPRALIQDEKSRLKRAHQSTASSSASASAAAATAAATPEEKTKKPPAAVYNNHNHKALHHHNNNNQHLSSPPPRIAVTPSSSTTSTSTMATSYRASSLSYSSGSSSSFSRLSPLSLYTGSPNSQTSLATSSGSLLSSSPEAPPAKMPPSSSSSSSPSLLLPSTKALTTTEPSKPVRPSVTPLAPRRSRSVPRGGHGGVSSYDLDRIDELDESDPLGMAFHHGGPYEAIKAQKLNSVSSVRFISPLPFYFIFTTAPIFPFLRVLPSVRVCLYTSSSDLVAIHMPTYHPLLHLRIFISANKLVLIHSLTLFLYCSHRVRKKRRRSGPANTNGNICLPISNFHSMRRWDSSQARSSRER
jgi:hypothetical protein